MKRLKTITAARIENVGETRVRVFACFGCPCEHYLFGYSPDDADFLPSDFVGLTLIEATELRFQKALLARRL